MGFKFEKGMCEEILVMINGLKNTLKQDAMRVINPMTNINKINLPDFPTFGLF